MKGPNWLPAWELIAFLVDARWWVKFKWLIETEDIEFCVVMMTVIVIFVWSSLVSCIMFVLYYWWLVRVNLVVVYGFWPNILGGGRDLRMVFCHSMKAGSVVVIPWSGGDTQTLPHAKNLLERFALTCGIRATWWNFH